MSFNRLINLFYITTTISLFYSPFSFGQTVVYPKEFPADLIGTKLCGTASTQGKMYGGSTAFIDVPFEVYISKDEGIYVNYNPRQKFGEDEWGTTQKIKSFKLYKSEPTNDRYGNLLGTTYYYQVPSTTDKHCINEISVYDFYKSDIAEAKRVLIIKIRVPSYDEATISSNFKSVSVCGTLKTADDIKNEEANKLKADKLSYSGIDKLVNSAKWSDAEVSINALNFPSSYPKYSTVTEKLALMKKEQEALLKKQQALEDSLLSVRINSKLQLQDLDSATLLFNKLHVTDLPLRTTIEKALLEKYSNEVKTVDGTVVAAFINDNKTKLLTLEPTTLKITMNQDGTFEGITSDYITKSIIPEYKTINGFKVPIPKSFWIKISTGTPLVVENSRKIFIDTYKEVLMKNNGKVYIANFFNRSIFHQPLSYYNPDQQKEYVKLHPELNGLKISEGNYAVIETSRTEYFANGASLGNKSTEIINSTAKMSKRVPKIVFRSITLPLYIVWWFFLNTNSI